MVIISPCCPGRNKHHIVFLGTVYDCDMTIWRQWICIFCKQIFDVGRTNAVPR